MRFGRLIAGRGARLLDVRKIREIEHAMFRCLVGKPSGRYPLQKSNCGRPTTLIVPARAR